MGFRLLVLVCSLTVPAAQPSRREAIPVGTLDLLSCKSSDAGLSDGHSHPLFAGRCDDPLCSSPMLSVCDETDSEEDLQISAFAIRQAGMINLAIAFSFSSHVSSPAAHVSSWCIPLRC